MGPARLKQAHQEAAVASFAWLPLAVQVPAGSPFALRAESPDSGRSRLKQTAHCG